MNLDTLTRWIEAQTDLRGPFEAEKFASGQSNPTYKLTSPSGTYVLRRKPEGALLKSAHAVDREFRVQKALADTGVPVVRMHTLCEDDAVIGTAFYVMDHVEGRIFFDPGLPDATPDERGAIYDAMLQVLAAIHSVDLDQTGLGDYGPEGHYLARQLGRWTKQYRASETEPLPDMDALIAGLEAALPEDDGQRTLVHGDYRIDNLIFAPDAPRVSAVLDWELSTTGHPYADLAALVMQWQLPPGKVGRGLAGLDRARLGLPTDADAIARYCALRGIDGIADFNVYLAFAFFRMAAILQGVKKRGLDGNASNPEQAALYGSFVPVFAEKGRAALNG
ncbi:phosphotransferase family protein [Pseudaestuariivita atlantica]|uniref:Aminoglycoside phosphotransferase n=1 Tax=Pseudaestuariivita atlantica TaxID=1317121 RepID=A0A0L1JRI5_9RHOB|nr:phosphotransferase family protein [Pseudaestuariivita atlantica]KNG94360.1 aminoglycoside phosphotransferase [Pseudaestuariivita atlantica]